MGMVHCGAAQSDLRRPRHAHDKSAPPQCNMARVRRTKSARRVKCRRSVAARSRTDDDEIVIAVVHADSSQCNPNPYAILESPDLFDENSRIDDPAYPGRVDEFPKQVMWVWCRCDTAGRTFRCVTIVGNG